MERDTLIAALVGALIATIPIMISNAVQIILHVSERRQKEREAKLQSREKWIERDILQTLEALDKVIKLMAEASVVDRPLRSPDLNMPRLNKEYFESYNLMTQLVYSLDDTAIYSEYDNYLSAANEYAREMGMLLTAVEESKTYEGDRGVKWDDVLEAAGKLQHALREKLISIRDT